MNDLPKQFPPKEVSNDTLDAIATRARRKFAANPNASAGPEPTAQRVSPFVAAAQQWMRGAGLGVLDLAAIAALLFISLSAAWMYLIAPSSKTKGAEGAPKIAHADEKGPVEKVTPPAPPKETQSLHTVAGDGPDTPKAPDPEPAPPQPKPVVLPKPETNSNALQPLPPEDEIIAPAHEIVPDEAKNLLLPNEMTAMTGDRNDVVADLPLAGSGAFGNRNGGGRRLMAKRFGGSKATEDSVDLALRWLAYHQEADGHFDAMKYGAANKTDTAVTALALLAFLGSGHTEKVGAYKENVKRAVAWLKSKQQANGLVYDQTDAGAHRGIGYPHGIASLALCEAAGMGRVPDTVAAAQASIDYAVNIQQNSGGGTRLGWRYAANTPGDICVSTWYIGALKSAKVAGLKVDHRAFDGAIQFLDSVAIMKGGNVHYAYQPGGDNNMRRDAMGNFCRQFLGWRAADLKTSVEAFVNEGGAPSWGANGATVDMYYWYYGTLCTFQQGGDIWQRWNEGLKKALIENQCKQGDDAGSWPVVGDFSGEWGRVGQTAFGALCCEVYYRYAMLNAPPAGGPMMAAAPPADPFKADANVAQPQPLGAKLKTKVSFNLIDKSLPDTVAFLNQLTEVKIKLDPKVAGQGAISLRVSEMELDLALDWVTKLGALAWHEENGVVVISTPQKLEEKKKPAGKDEF